VLQFRWALYLGIPIALYMVATPSSVKSFLRAVGLEHMQAKEEIQLHQRMVQEGREERKRRIAERDERLQSKLDERQQQQRSSSSPSSSSTSSS